MSDQQWPDLSAPYPGGGQPSQDPATPPAPSQEGAPSPYLSQPSQPMTPFGTPPDPAQTGQPSQYGQYGQPGQYGEPGQYGQYGQQPQSQAPNPYGQPAAPSQPMYPYGQPAAPSQPMYPYGQPAAPSQPMYPYPQGDPTVQSTPLSQPAAPSQPMYPYGQPSAPSQPLTPYGQFGGPSQALPPQPQKPRRSLKWLWITLGVLVVLLAAGGGGAVYVVSQLAAPATAATQFCTDLKSQNYDAAYAQLSNSLHSQYTHDQFVQGNQALDQLEGLVTACAPSTSGGGYHYSFGANTATIAASITRSKQSANLTGTLSLASEGGAWKVSGITTSLLGVNLGAVQAASGFCTALENKDYTTASGLLDSTISIAPSDWTTWDQIGGAISKCSLQGLGTGNTDSAASFEIGISRSTGGLQTGALGLTLEGSAWKVISVDAGLLGPDLGPLKIGTQFCQDLLTGNYTDAWGLLSSAAQADFVSKSQFEASFALPSGVYWASFTPKLSTYNVSGTSGNYDATAVLSNGSVSVNVTLSLTFVEDGTDWKVDTVVPSAG
jgi:hypothetical protein